jgi:radical SAM protein with 4Fe4S-binding SPASM domain
MFPCSGPWKTPAIGKDGRVTVCCRDYNFQLCLGNIKDNTFLELWFGDKIKKIRELHMTGRHLELPPCDECTGLDDAVEDDLLSKTVEFYKDK